MSLNVCPTGHVICPYNKSHVIRNERIQFHLTKCQPKPGDKPFAVCPFNSTHVIPVTEINNHKANLCPDRKQIETLLYEIDDVKPLFPVKKFEVESEENWDDCVKHTYNPEEVLSDKKILLLKQVAPPAERRKFQLEQRKKFQTIPDEPVKNNKTKPRPPHRPDNPNNIKEKIQVEEKKMEPMINKMESIINKMENTNITENKPTDEFELVVGKKKKKKRNTKKNDNQKELVKTKDTNQNKSETKVKKQVVLNETLKLNHEDSGNVSSRENYSVEAKENFSTEIKENDFIVVTKKKNKTRKH